MRAGPFFSSLAALAFLISPAFAADSPDAAVEAAVARLGKVLTFHRESRASPREVDLGRKLFSDPRLSLNGKMSCATCHIPFRHFEDGLPRAVGRAGKPVSRNTPSLLNATF